MFAKILHRPVLAIVLSIVIILLGVLSLRARPISQFPEIAPPQVQVAVAYPGASADVLIQSTLIPLERAINGVPGMRYMISDATSAGEATIRSSLTSTPTRTRPSSTSRPGSTRS
jgi:HAE1 family hydrophobic/amphiphilic exporter-1